MFTKKPKKSQLSEKTPYTLWPGYHSVEREREPTECLQIVSIDPGIKNLAIRIEQRHSDGTIFPLVFEVYDAKNDDMTITYTIITKILESLTDYFRDSHMLIIERQLPENYRTVRLS